MESNEFQDLMRQRKDALLVPWTAMTVSIGAWAIAASVLTQEQLPRELPSYVGAGFWIVVLVLVVASIVVPGKALETRRLTAYMRAEPAPRRLATRGNDVDADLLHQLTALPKGEQRLYGLTQLAMKSMIVGLAISEGIGVVALVYSLVASNLLAGFPMLLVAFAVNAWHFPRLERLLDRGRKQQANEDLEDFDQNLRDMEKDLKKRPRRASRPQPKS